MDSNTEANDEQRRDHITPDAYRLLREALGSDDSDDSDDGEATNYIVYSASMLRSVLFDAAQDGSPKELRALAHLIWVAENWAAS